MSFLFRVAHDNDKTLEEFDLPLILWYIFERINQYTFFFLVIDYQHKSRFWRICIQRGKLNSSTKKRKKKKDQEWCIVSL